MKSIRYRYRKRDSGAEINMAPLIDMIFILLIFFLVTATFTQEAVVDIERPTAESATDQESNRLTISIDRNQVVYVDGKSVDIRFLQPRVRKVLSSDPGQTVVIVADRATTTGFVVRVMDLCRLAGARNISLAAQREQ